MDLFVSYTESDSLGPKENSQSKYDHFMTPFCELLFSPPSHQHPCFSWLVTIHPAGTASGVTPSCIPTACVPLGLFPISLSTTHTSCFVIPVYTWCLLQNRHLIKKGGRRERRRRRETQNPEIPTELSMRDECFSLS